MRCSPPATVRFSIDSVPEGGQVAVENHRLDSGEDVFVESEKAREAI